MVGAEIKGKKLKIGEGEEEVNNNIDEALVVSIEKLQEIQDELEKINDEASEKVLEVEQKYSEVRKSMYAKRNEIINSIPDFWLTAFASHPALGSLLTEEDHKIFKYLSSLEVEESKDLKSGYSITLNFQTNPYFEDTKLTKTFTFLEDDTAKVTSTPINWKEGMGMPNGVPQEEKGNKRPLDEDSFFCWFANTEIDEMQYEVADFIKDDLWPNPLSYFNNEADEEDSDGDEADDGVNFFFFMHAVLLVDLLIESRQHTLQYGSTLMIFLLWKRIVKTDIFFFDTSQYGSSAILQYGSYRCECAGYLGNGSEIMKMLVL